MIDQWVLNGGATLIFLDPYAETEISKQQGMPPMNPRSNVKKLLDTWGINLSLTANNGDAMMQLALSGHGIIMLPSFFVWEALEKGDLIQILENYSLPTMHAYAIYPATRYLPLKVRSLIDFLIERFGDNPYWDQHTT
jgi:DNA-binding transcriptional LysR family regulator